MVISALTLTMTNMECYFRMRDGAKKRSWPNILKRNVLVMPYFMTNCIFKILTMGLIFAIFHMWGLFILFMWSFSYTRLMVYLHQNHSHVVANLFGMGPVNALIVHPGTLPTSKNMANPPLRYKAIMRLSVWINFAFNSVWLLYGLALKLYVEGQYHAVQSKGITDTFDCIQTATLKRLTLFIWCIGLISCLIMETYLSKFPQLLGLNKDDDYCSTIEGLDDGYQNIDIVNDTFEITETCMESSDVFQLSI